MRPQSRQELDATAELVRLLAISGARYDAAPLFPTESLALIREAGLHRRFAPLKARGEHFPDERHRYAAMGDALRLVGRGDLSVGRLFEGHINALLLFGWYGTAQQIDWFGRELDRGAWFGVWAIEPQPGVRLSSDDPSILSGSKAFASGAGGLDHAIVTASAGDGHRRLAIVPANDPGRADLSAWRARGMRATASGRYNLDGIVVEPSSLLGETGDYDRDPRFTAGAWRFCAAQLGGIEALVSETRIAMSDSARKDPIQRARLTDAVVATRTASFWVTEAALRAASEDRDAVTIARLTRGVVENAGFVAMEAAARIVGTRSAFDGERIDKIIRDLSLYLRQAGPDHAKDQAALALLDHDSWQEADGPW